MSDTVFRAKAEPVATPVVKSTTPTDTSVPRGVTNIDVPFTEYHSQNGHPFLVDHYELGQYWDHSDMYSDGFKTEINDINRYLGYLIDKGEINNTTDSVKNELKRIEKMINVDKNSRKSVRMGVISEYTNFLLKSENIKKESAKQGMI